MNRPPGNRLALWRQDRAFARSDLLVILAVISVLSALLISIQTALRQKTQLTLCQSNLHEVSRAILLFAGDHEERLPGPDPTLPGDVWWWYKEQVKRYANQPGSLGNAGKLFACPRDRGYSDPRPFCQTARFDDSSYVFNGVTLPGVPSVVGWKVPVVHEPIRTLLAMEWSAHAPLSWHRSRTGRSNAPFYSDAKSVLGFVDGHVSFSEVYYDGYNAAYTRDPIPGYDYKFSGQ